jgi:predicted DNA-binding transcriptional regulator AlpA
MNPRDEQSRAEARERTLLHRIKSFDALPDGATLGLRETVLIVGMSRATIYRRMALGTFPRPTHAYNGNRWRVGDIRRFLAGAKR